MVASGNSRPGCHWKSGLLSKKRALKPVGASRAARLRLKGPTPTPTASSVTSVSITFQITGEVAAYVRISRIAVMPHLSWMVKTLVVFSGTSRGDGGINQRQGRGAHGVR